MSSPSSFSTDGTAPGTYARRIAVGGVRVLAVLLPLVCVTLALRGGLGLWLFGTLAFVFAAFAFWYRRFLGDYSRSLAVPGTGSLEVTDDGLVLHHPGVLSEDVLISWTAVRTVCVDPSGEPDSADRFVIAEPAEGGPPALFTNLPRRLRRTGGVPLMASAPVTPNVAVLLDPPVLVPWHYPFIVGPFNPPRADPWPARPWVCSKPTPAILTALADALGFAAALDGLAKVRGAEADDAEYLAAEGIRW